MATKLPCRSKEACLTYYPALAHLQRELQKAKKKKKQSLARK